MKNNDRHLTTYHEAGHAVAAMALGFKVEEVSIVPSGDGDTLGHCKLAGVFVHPSAHRRIGREVRAECRDHIKHMLAGEIAERRATLGQYKQWRSEDDRSHAYDYAMYLSRNPNRYLATLRKETTSLLAARWCDVQAVAQALLQHDRLTGDDVAALLEQEVSNA